MNSANSHTGQSKWWGLWYKIKTRKQSAVSFFSRNIAGKLLGGNKWQPSKATLSLFRILINLVLSKVTFCLF